MNNSVIELVFKAKDEASAHIEGIARKAEGMGEAFTKMRNIGVAAFAGISAIVYKTTSDYADAEKSAKMLEHAVMEVSHATREQLDATAALADELERKGVLDGDNIKMGLAQLSTFGLSNQAVQKLGGSLADLAVNQFGVSASGEQLSDTANMIAKALNGQFGVLEKSGIRFTEAQKHAIEFGTEMEKVDAINQGFAQNLKYTNEVALTTLEGQMAKTKVQVGNVSEAIGETLTPILKGLMEKIVPIVQKVLDWINAHQELTQKIIIVVGAIAGLLAIVGTVGLVIPSIIAGFSAVGSIISFVSGIVPILSSVLTALGSVLTFLAANPIVLIIAAVVALVAGIIWMITHWDLVKQKVQEVWDYISPYLIGVWETITGKLRGWVEGIWTAITTAFNKVKDFILGIWNGIKETIGGVIDWIMDKINAVLGSINNVVNKVSSIGSSIGSGVSSAWNSVSNFFSGKKARGGDVYTGSSYLVGENGPEIFTPNSTGKIIPNNNMGGGLVLNITGNTFLGEDEVASKIGKAIIKQLNFEYKY